MVKIVRSDDVVSDDVAVEVLAGRVAVNCDASEAVAPDEVALHEVVVDGAACTVGAARYRRREDHSGPLTEDPVVRDHVVDYGVVVDATGCRDVVPRPGEIGRA